MNDVVVFLSEKIMHEEDEKKNNRLKKKKSFENFQKQKTKNSSPFCTLFYSQNTHRDESASYYYH